MADVAFNPDQYLAEKGAQPASPQGFDPDKYLAQKVGGENPNAPGKFQTFGEHAGNALTFGYLPQLQAAAEPLETKALNAITGQNVEPDSYMKARDANIKRLQAEQDANPKTALAGTVSGGLVGAMATPLPGANLVTKIPGAGLLGSGFVGKAAAGAAKGALYGTAQGALSNPGDVEGKVDPVQLQERGDNALHGMGMGAALGGLAGTAEAGINALSKSGDSAQAFANNKAFKAAGGMLKDFRAAGEKGIQKVGQFMLDNGLVKAGDTVEDIAEKATAFNKNAGEALDKVYEGATGSMSKEVAPEVANAIDEAGFNPIRDKGKILQAAKDHLGDSVGSGAALEKLSGYLDTVGGKYGDATLNPRIANDIKGALDEEINYSRNPLTKQPGVEKAFVAARRELADKIESHIEALGNASGDEAATEALKKANADYGNSARVKQMATDRVNRESANRAFGLTDTIAGSGGAGVGGMLGHAAAGPAGGVAGAAAGAVIGGGINKFARTRGPALQAAVANKLAPALDNTAAPIGQGLSSIYNPDTVTRALTERGLLNKKK